MFGACCFGCCKVDGSAEALKLALANYQDGFLFSFPVQTQYTFSLFSYSFYATTGSYNVCGYGRVYRPDAGE
jgi:hypothetical protein